MMMRAFDLCANAHRIGRRSDKTKVGGKIAPAGKQENGNDL